MEKYIGLDVHATTCTFAVISQGGRRLKSDVIETNGRALVSYVKQIAGRKHLVFEEGTQSAWLYEILRPHVDEVAVTVPKERLRSKSDESDALALAEALRVGGLKTRVHKDRGALGSLKELTLVYSKLLQDSVRAQNRLRAMFRSRGIDSEGLTSFRDEKEWNAWAAKLPPRMRSPARMLCEEMVVIDALLAQARTAMVNEAKKHRAWRILQTCPGLGEIRTAMLMAIVISPSRFRTSRQFWSYCGLAVTTHSSADWRRDREGQWRRREPMTRGLNRAHNRELKEVFAGAAMTVAAKLPKDPLHASYQKSVERGLKPAVARIHLARKIAAIVLRMWKNMEVYDSAKIRSQK